MADQVWVKFIALNRISSMEAMAASIAIDADLMNKSRPVLLAVAGMVRFPAKFQHVPPGEWKRTGREPWRWD